MKLRTWLPAAAALSVALSGLGAVTQAASQIRPAPRSGGILTVAIPSDPPGLDPMWQTANITQDICINVVEQLFTLNAKNGFSPLLVQNYAITQGGRDYTFHLRQGVRFQNGQIMTSADVLASFLRWKALSSRAQALLSHMTSATAPNPSTFVVDFSQPNGAFISALAIPNQQMFILEKSQIDQYMSGGQYEQIPGAKLIGTGPYEIKQWLPGKELDLVKFRGYDSPSGPSNGLAGTRHAYVNEIRYVVVPDPLATVTGIATGQYNIAYSLPTSLYPEVKAQAGVVPQVTKPGFGVVAVFNKQTGVFTSRLMREAAWYAINPAAVMKGAIQNPVFYRLTPALAGPTWALWHSLVGANVYTGAPNLQKAKALLKDAGYKNQPIVWITTKDYGYMYGSALVASQEMQRAGFNVRLEVYSWPTVVSMRSNPNDFSIFSTGIGFTGDPTGTAAFTPGWPGWFNNAANNRNYQALVTTVSQSQRARLAVQQQAIFWQQLPYLQFGETYNFRAYSPNVVNMINGPVFALFNVGLK